MDVCEPQFAAKIIGLPRYAALKCCLPRLGYKSTGPAWAGTALSDNSAIGCLVRPLVFSWQAPCCGAFHSTTAAGEVGRSRFRSVIRTSRMQAAAAKWRCSVRSPNALDARFSRRFIGASLAFPKSGSRRLHQQRCGMEKAPPHGRLPGENQRAAKTSIRRVVAIGRAAKQDQ